MATHRNRSNTRCGSIEINIIKCKDGVETITKQDNVNPRSKSLARVMKGTRNRPRKKILESDDEDSDEEEQLVCSMSGRQWEALPFPMVIDSGACASVLPIDWCAHVQLLKTPQSEAKEYFRAANEKKIYNEGQKLVSMMTKEGAMRDISFTVCSVTKALGSVSQMCRAGNRVVFNPPWDHAGSYIENEQTGERLWLEEQGGGTYCTRRLHHKINRQATSMG